MIKMMKMMFSMKPPIEIGKFKAGFQQESVIPEDWVMLKIDIEAGHGEPWRLAKSRGYPQSSKS